MAKGKKKPSPAKEEKLTPVETVFALEYLSNGLNAAKAYRAAHPKANANTSKVEGHRYLTKPNVSNFIRREQKARFRRLHMDGDETLARVALDARADLAELFDQQDKMLPPSKWPQSMRNSIEQITIRPDGTTSVKLASKTAARRTLLEQSGQLRTPLDAAMTALERALRQDLGDTDDDDQ